MMVTDDRRIPFIQIETARMRDPSVSLQAKAIYTVLVSWADFGSVDGDRKGARPSRKTLADNCGVHPNTVDKYVRELADAKWIKVVARYEDDERTRRPNEYVILSQQAVGGITAHCEGGITPECERVSQHTVKDLEPDDREPVDQQPLLTAEAVEAEGPTFDEWWKAYRDVCRGRPTGAGSRQPAEKSWDKLDPDDRQQALDAVGAYGRLLELEDGDRQKPYPSKHGSTWLNQRTFDDVSQQLEDRRAASSSASSGGGRRPPPVEAIA